MRLSICARRTLCCLLCAALLLSLLPSAQAADKTLILAQAESMALAASKEISKKYNEILLKKMKYVEAVEGAKAKAKNKQSFRWSPLLSFKFPQPLNMIEGYELNVKPLVLQTEIATLQHEMNDLRYQVLSDVDKCFVELYLLQEKLAFTEVQLSNAQNDLERNRARLLTGDATQTDIETMESQVEGFTNEVSNLKRNLENKKKDLTDIIKLDVTSGYTFRNPLLELSMPRSVLDSVIEYTLANDQGFYEAKAAASTALINLESYESLMQRQYGRKMDLIQGFINMAKQGLDVDYAAFQMKFKEFVQLIDKPWNSKMRILFFTFTMEWFKGEISGSRYIEDEMYAVYTACMEYSSAKNERDAQEKALRKQVSSSYESLMTAWKSYESMAKFSEDMGRSCEKILALNKLGKATYDEVKDAQTAYQDAQLEALDTLGMYNTLLFDFDRLTCGAVTKYLKGASLDVSASGGGDSLASVDVINDPYYYIYTSVADMTFHIGVSIPDGFEPAITDFELWSGETQIGGRTPVGQELRHLTLDYADSSLMTLRFYDGEQYVAECEIDTSVARDVLELEGEVPEPLEARVIGSYKVSTHAYNGISTSELTLEPDASVGAKTYAIRYGEQGVYSSGTIDIGEPFTYLTLLIASLEEVSIHFYDRDGTLVTTATFNTEREAIIRD